MGIYFPPLLIAPLLLSIADAPDRAAPQDPELIATTLTDEGVLIALGALKKRMTVPVVVGDSGPYRFIIDTGAERTVVSHELANTLKLRAGAPVRLISMTSISSVGTVVVEDLAIAEMRQRHRIIAPSLHARHLGAAGLLGIDTLSRHKVRIDFTTNIMSVQPSEKRDRHRPAAANEIVVQAKNMLGQLIVTDAYYGDTRIQVILDTGSEVTVGNDALRRRVGNKARNPAPIEMISVTGETSVANYTDVPNIRIGDIRFGSIPVAFSEVEPFRRFGLTKRPALLVGMDVLRTFREVNIDFPNRQVRFKIPDKIPIRHTAEF